MPALGALATRYCSGLAGTPLFMTNRYQPINGKRGSEFPGSCPDLYCKGFDMSVASYLKKHCEALVKDVGIEAACEITGKSKATLGRVDKRDSHRVLTVIQAVICDGDQLGTRPDVGRRVGVL